MSAGTPAGAGPTRDELERSLADRLGISPNASPEEIAAAHDAVARFLADAPRDLRGWAAARAAEADEAFALLSDPAALAGAVALVGTAAEPAHAPGGSATPPTRRAAPPDEDDGEELEGILAEAEPDLHRDVTTAGSAASARVRARPTRRAATRASLKVKRAPRWRRPAIVGLVLAGVAVVVIGVYQLGAPPTTASNNGSQGTPAPSPTLDEAKVSALMTQLQQNPNDTTTLMSLANEFYAAGDYESAATWLDKLLVIDPENVQGLLALGAAKFNVGDSATAKTQWEKVVALDPSNVEAHYDLGFLYLSEQPPDEASMQREWQKVIELAPGSDVANAVQAHLDALASASPAASPAASAAPAVSGSPEASPVPSASPASSTEPSPSPAASGSAQP